MFILNQKNYERRLFNFNEEMTVIALEETKGYEILQKEVKEIDPNTFSVEQYLEFSVRRRAVKECADAKRKSAYWWFTWYPVVLNCILLAIVVVVVKFLVLPFIF